MSTRESVTRRCGRGVLIGLFLAFCSTGVIEARDFFELLEIVDPFVYPPAQTGFLPSAVTAFEYNSYSLASNDSNSFDVRLHAGITVYGGQRVAVKVHFGSYLVVGPVAPEEDPASIAEWWMNAVYYSYGAAVGARLGPGAVVAEYSRYSFHPWRGGFNDPAGESIRVGYSFPEFRRHGLVISSLVRLGYVDLFEYWKADIVDPVARWVLRTNVVASYDRTRPAPFTRLNLDVRALRAGGFDAVVGGDLGVAACGAAGRLELYTTVYATPDTEELKGDDPAPAFLAGFGVRFRGRSPGEQSTGARR